MDSTFVVGIDVGGQTSKIGVVDASGNVLAQTVIRTDTHDQVGLYIAELAEAVKGLIKESGTEGKVKGIGVGAPNGNYYTGTIENAPNLTWGHDKVEFSKLLSEAMGGLPVSLTNDANAAAVGEMTYGAAKGMKNFIMITLGTGVGSGIVINGDVVYGHDGFAGELGHVTAVRTTDVCADAARQDVSRLMLLLQELRVRRESGLNFQTSHLSSGVWTKSLLRTFMRLQRPVISLLSRSSSSQERSSDARLLTSSHSAPLRLSSSSAVLHVQKNSSQLLSRTQ